MKVGLTAVDSGLRVSLISGGGGGGGSTLYMKNI